MRALVGLVLLAAARHRASRLRLLKTCRLGRADGRFVAAPTPPDLQCSHFLLERTRRAQAGTERRLRCTRMSDGGGKRDRAASQREPDAKGPHVGPVDAVAVAPRSVTVAGQERLDARQPHASAERGRHGAPRVELLAAEKGAAARLERGLDEAEGAEQHVGRERHAQSRCNSRRANASGEERCRRAGQAKRYRERLVAGIGGLEAELGDVLCPMSRGTMSRRTRDGPVASAAVTELDAPVAASVRGRGLGRDVDALDGEARAAGGIGTASAQPDQLVVRACITQIERASLGAPTGESE